MKKGVVIIGLIIAGLIEVGVLVFSATLELIEGVFTLIGWGVLILIGWLVYQFKFKS